MQTRLIPDKNLVKLRMGLWPDWIGQIISIYYNSLILLHYLHFSKTEYANEIS